MWREKLQIKKDNVIAGLYPFAKLWILGLFSVCCIILSTIKVEGYSVYLIYACAVPLLLAACTGIFGKFMSAFGKLIFLAVIILIAQAVLFPGPVSLWQYNVFGLFTVHIYEAGLQKGVGLAFTILDIAGIFVWLFQSTENKELVCAFEKKGMSPKAGYVLLSTLQMISVLQQSSKAIMSAQEARGVETKGNLIVRMKAFIPSIIPLVLGAINNTEERVLTLESKGFSSHCQKTRLFDIQPNGKEMLAQGIAIAATVLVIVWRVLA